MIDKPHDVLDGDTGGVAKPVLAYSGADFHDPRDVGCGRSADQGASPDNDAIL
jgi:hypothetical protein